MRESPENEAASEPRADRKDNRHDGQKGGTVLGQETHPGKTTFGTFEEQKPLAVEVA